MKRYMRFIRGISLLVVLFFAWTVISCGTILYPERRGQPAGRIDVGV
ncbi:MAG: polyribonucleotide nucleotidyltransferase, partial [Deltaproteobacteria bacterium]|nr:polyribonucleotide nucleotidyltransferase [Deltaproteobacteria bacterium]